MPKPGGFLACYGWIMAPGLPHGGGFNLIEDEKISDVLHYVEVKFSCS
jgi:hypothetical protein